MKIKQSILKQPGFPDVSSTGLDTGMSRTMRMRDEPKSITEMKLQKLPGPQKRLSSLSIASASTKKTHLDEKKLMD